MLLSPFNCHFLLLFIGLFYINISYASVYAVSLLSVVLTVISRSVLLLLLYCNIGSIGLSSA